MKVKVSKEGDILIGDKIVSEEDVSTDIALLKRSREDSKTILKMCAARDTTLKGYNDRIKVSKEGDILIEDKKVTDTDVANHIAVLGMAQEDSKKILEMIKQRDVILKDYNSHGKDTLEVSIEGSKQ